MTSRVVAIIPAAGSGKRLRTSEKKPFVLLGGKPLIAYALKALDSSRYIDAIIVAVEESFIARLKGIISRYGIKKVARIVRGGKTRHGSVKNCFYSIDRPCVIVLIHDGARPFPQGSMIRDSIILAAKFGACITAVRQTDTVKSADKNLFVLKTLDRKNMWRAQTPQAFRYGLLKSAISRINDGADITDDASYVERLGKKVKILEGSAKNIKITTKEDLKIARGLLCV